MSYFPPPCQVPGWIAALGSSEPHSRVYYKPYRPGDIVQAFDEFLGMEEVSIPGEPIRKFNAASKRTYLDQQEEPISHQIMSGLVNAMPPDKLSESREQLYQGHVLFESEAVVLLPSLD